jgi:hypothetical protein
MTYDRLVQARTLFETLPAAPRDKIALSSRIQHNSATDTGPIRLWVIDRGNRIPLRLAPDGTLSVRPITS